MFFSKFLNAIRENLTSDEKFQSVNHDLQMLLPWFMIDNFVHNIDLIALSRKSFRPQNSDDETVLEKQMQNPKEQNQYEQSKPVTNTKL